jgi:hypothetical protein
MFQHPKITPQPKDETEDPFSVYVEAAHEQIARTRANSDWLNGTRARDADIARALAHMNRDADRADRARGVRS